MDEEISRNNFNEIYNHIDTIIDFNPAWIDENKYLSKAVIGKFKVTLPIGSMAKSLSLDVDFFNIECIFVGTPYGTIVVFTNVDGEEIISYCASDRLEEVILFPLNDLNEFDVMYILGDVNNYPNIGKRLEHQNMVFVNSITPLLTDVTNSFNHLLSNLKLGNIPGVNNVEEEYIEDTTLPMSLDELVKEFSNFRKSDSMVNVNLYDMQTIGAYGIYLSKKYNFKAPLNWTLIAHAVGDALKN